MLIIIKELLINFSLMLKLIFISSPWGVLQQLKTHFFGFLQ